MSVSYLDCCETLRLKIGEVKVLRLILVVILMGCKRYSTEVLKLLANLDDLVTELKMTVLTLGSVEPIAMLKYSVVNSLHNVKIVGVHFCNLDRQCIFVPSPCGSFISLCLPFRLLNHTSSSTEKFVNLFVTVGALVVIKTQGVSDMRFVQNSILPGF